MEAVDYLLVRGVEHLERRHHLPRGERIDLQLAAGQLVHPLGEKAEVVLQASSSPATRTAS